MALGDHLGKDRQGDLLRGPGSDIHAGGSADTGLLIVGEVEGGEDGRATLAARDKADIGNA